jgi:hypothetical protein
MRRSSRHPAIPGPSGDPSLDMFLHLRRATFRYLTAAACRYGEVVSLPLGVRQVYLLAHLTYIRHVL